MPNTVQFHQVLRRRRNASPVRSSKAWMGRRRQTDDSTVESLRLGPEHPKYAAVLNERFTGRPDYVRLVASTEHVLAAVQEAVTDRDPRNVFRHALSVRAADCDNVYLHAYFDTENSASRYFDLACYIAGQMRAMTPR